MGHNFCMAIRLLTVGKKHESWVSDGIARYEQRLRRPFDLSWQLLPHSTRDGDAARDEESSRILARTGPTDTVILLDERGKLFTSPQLHALMSARFSAGEKLTFVIGGAYGVTEELRARANVVWSLSPLVFPHQLVRLIVVEQLYRAQSIGTGSPYHHA